MDSPARLHRELIGLLRQHCPVADERHLVLLGWMVAGLLLSQNVCFGHWQQLLPLHPCQASSWQRRCRRWLSNGRIDPGSLCGPLMLWAMQQWQTPGQALPLALDTTVLWNRFCVVVISVVCHGRAIPLLWQTLEHPSASVSAEVVIALLQRADRLLTGFHAITVLADRAFPSADLLGWFEARPRWRYVMRLRSDTWIHGTAAPMGCEVRRLRLPRGHCRGFREIRLWDGGHRANLVLARPICEQLFRDQKSGIFQLERSGLRDPARIDRLLLVVAIAVLISALQGYAVSLGGERRRVDPHWKRGLSFARIGLHWLQQSVIAFGRMLLAWMPIPLQTLESCIPSRGVLRRQKQPMFSQVELPPHLESTTPMAIA